MDPQAPQNDQPQVMPPAQDGGMPGNDGGDAPAAPAPEAPAEGGNDQPAGM